MNCTIINFTEHEKLSTSEVIAHGDLSAQMTQHGLGSGIYGFVDKNSAGEYKGYKYVTDIRMENCFIIDSKAKLGIFIQLSTTINQLCFTLYNLYLSGDNTFDMFIPDIVAVISKIDVPSIMPRLPFLKIIEGIRMFVDDYILLMSTPYEKEHYIAMPINYILAGLYDGIYNLESDNPANGSVAYSYTNPRSCKRAFRFRGNDPLKGQRIYNQLFYSDNEVKATLRHDFKAKRPITKIVFNS